MLFPHFWQHQTLLLTVVDSELGSFAIWARFSLLSLGPLPVGRLQTGSLDI
jgi:hypothetical protein